MWPFSRLFEKKATGDVIGMTEGALQLAQESAKHSHPNEFMGLLRAVPANEVHERFEENKRIVVSVLLIPGTKTNQTSASYKSHSVPNDNSIVGSIHSHPSGVIKPSDQDLSMFTKGPVNIIMGRPYRENDWKAFNRFGEPRQFKVIDEEYDDGTSDLNID